MPSSSTHHIPAIALPLTGRYLIEASAGTGKTWTLTGIVLRLLIEGKRPCEQIIATTFTRAAAAEMRERIRSRLTDFKHLLHVSLNASKNSHHLTNPTLFNTSSPLPNFKQLCQQLNQQPAMATLLADPINHHLLHYLLQPQHNHSLADAYTRVTLALNTLDRLFINTLDSLCQKWLHEYSSETGYNPSIQISPNPQQFIHTIAHDALRHFQAELYTNQPQAYQLLQQQQQLSLTPAHISAINMALNFNHAPIDNVTITQFDFTGFKRLIDRILTADSSTLEDFILPTGCKYASLKGQLKNNGEQWHSIVATLNGFGVAASLQFNEQQQRFFTAIEKTDNIGSQFLKKYLSDNSLFNELELVQLLKRYCLQQQQLNDYLQALKQHLVGQLCQKVREQLPVMLEQQQQTSFALQLQRLNQALAGQTGQALARYIRHHYPVALIDESQDMNRDQAQLIEQIYLADVTTATLPANGLLLLVGDPKQAIYGFRGGDVANYNALKQRFHPKNIYQLTVNRRSNANLITSLNTLFSRTSTENPLPNQLGQHIFYHQIAAARENCQWFNSDGTPIQHTINLLHIDNDDDLAESVAKQIALLLDPQHPVYQITNTGKKKPTELTDICVLGRTRHDITKVEAKLQQLGIATLKTSDVSVFADTMAYAMASVMQAMLNPFNISLINRALVSPLFAFNQSQLNQLQQPTTKNLHTRQPNIGTATTTTAKGNTIAEHNCTIEDFQQLFAKYGKHWQQYGFLSAWQGLMNTPICLPIITTSKINTTVPAETTNLWQHLARQNHAERLLVDMRHLLDVISTQAQTLGEHQLLTWLLTQLTEAPTDDWALQQPLPSATGVQLMTIHKSKGLEFAIVFAIGLDASVGKLTNTALYIYDAVSNIAIGQQNIPKDTKKNKQNPATLASTPTMTSHSLQRRLTPIAVTAQHDHSETYRQHQFEESLRLSYVAFTRASELLYIVSNHAKKRKDYAPLNRWLDAHYLVPTHLQKTIHTVFSHQLTVPSHFNYQQSQHDQQKWLDYPPAPQQTWFTGWQKTSFSALARELDHSKQDVAIHTADYCTELDNETNNDTADNTHVDNTSNTAQPALTATPQLIQPLTLTDQTNLPLRFCFTKGANAGSFLHTVLENLDMQHSASWATTIEQHLAEFNMPASLGSLNYQQRQHNQQQTEQPTQQIQPDDSEHQALLHWLSEITSTPLMASGICLTNIHPDKRYPELSFNMGLTAQFDPKQLMPLFAKHHKPLYLSDHMRNHQLRFLRGEIDLVYEHQQKFYVLDYKSNFLGTHWADYQPQKLAETMNHAGYWLQAAIYQVALHRLLKWRLPNYHPKTHLGAVEYAFLRGMRPVHNPTQTTGLISWQVPTKLVLALDKLFGSTHG